MTRDGGEDTGGKGDPVMARLYIFVRTTNKASVNIDGRELSFGMETGKVEWGSASSYFYDDRYEIRLRSNDGTEIELRFDTMILLALRSMLDHLLEEKTRNYNQYSFKIYSQAFKAIQ